VLQSRLKKLNNVICLSSFLIIAWFLVFWLDTLASYVRGALLKMFFISTTLLPRRIAAGGRLDHGCLHLQPLQGNYGRWCTLLASFDLRHW